MVVVKQSAVEFRLFRPQAGAVDLVGDFTDWQRGQLPMSRNDQGYWTIRIHLGPGVFRFRYFVDGQWFLDYSACGIERGPFGLDSLVHVRGPHDPHLCRTVHAVDARVGLMASSQMARVHAELLVGNRA